MIEHSIQLPDILAKAKNLLVLERNEKTIRKVNDLLQSAYDLQHELFEWDLNMPPQFSCKTLFHSSGPFPPATKNESSFAEEALESDVWRPGPIHIYEDLQIASIRNNNRVSQLLCSSVVIDSLKWLDPEGYAGDRRYKAAAYRVRYLVDDVVASVPFHLGYRLSDSSSDLSPDEPNGPRRKAASATGAYFVLYPLYVSSQLDEVPELQRRWITAKLEFIAKR